MNNPKSLEEEFTIKNSYPSRNEFYVQDDDDNVIEEEEKHNQTKKKWWQI